MHELGKAIGDRNLAIRLTPYGVFNQIRAQQRQETWQTLCRKLKHLHPDLSYVSFVEPVSLPLISIYHLATKPVDLITLFV